MAQLAHYAEMPWLGVRNVITPFSVPNVLMGTLWNKTEMDRLFCPMVTVSNVIPIVLLVIRRKLIAQVATVDIL